jgi:hypothetical protein
MVTKKAVKKAAPKKAAKPAKAAPKAVEKKLVGEISHFFDKILVAVVEVKSEMKTGDTILIEGPMTNLKQKVDSMQIEHEKVAAAKKGQSIGMKVAGPVRKKDLVYKV